jgi:hypothetical protein
VGGLRTTVAAVAGAVLVLAGCTVQDGSAGGSDSPTTSDSPASPAKSASKSPSTTAAADLPEPPPDDACYRLAFDEATEPTNDSPPVPCGRRHTAQTYHVGRLDTVVDGHLLAVDSRLAQRQVARTCPRVLARYLGGSAEARALSRLEAVWFSPTIEESDEGASWFRCDVVAVAGTGRLAPLPRRLRGLLDDTGALDRVGLCGTAAPGARGFERVICSRRHAWRAMSTIPISGDGPYPGVEAVREAGESTCRNRVREASGSPERFTYGWEWPTRDQWRTGQRFGYCWAPD